MEFWCSLSNALVPLAVFYMVGFGLLQKRPVLEDFLDGAKEGMRTTATGNAYVNWLNDSGRRTAFVRIFGFFMPIFRKTGEWLHLPAPIVPVALVRLVSNAAATSLVLDIFKTSGPDSVEGMIGSF